MAVGSFMGKTFTVSDKKIFTVSKLTGSSGTDYAQHNRPGLKPTSQYLSPKLDSYDVEILLRAQDGVRPRATLEYFKQKLEEGKADYFIIGTKALSTNRFIIKDISDDWQSVIADGLAIEIKFTMTIEEYL